VRRLTIDFGDALYVPGTWSPNASWPCLAVEVSVQIRPSRRAEDDPDYANIADGLLGAVGPAARRPRRPSRLSFT
jgi:hypothetical protein